MGHATVRISEPTRELLRQLAEAEGSPMQAVLQRALEAYRRQRFLAEVNAAYAQLRQDPGVWAEIKEEREAWDRTLGDGLPAEAAPVRPRKRSGRKPRSRK